MAGIILGFIYLYHYSDRSTADTLKFFDDSKLLFDLVKTHPEKFFKIFTGIGADDPELTPTYLQMNTWMYEEFINANRTMVRIDALFRFFIPENYYFVHVIFINFLSFIGLVYLYRVFSENLSLNKILIYLSVFFAPSLLFWGSGLLKEGILLFALGGFVYHFIRSMKPGSSYYYLMGLLFFGLLLTLIKVYMLLVIVPASVGYFWCSINRRNIVMKYFLSIALSFSLMFSISIVVPRFDLSHYLYVKQRDFLDIVRTEQPTSAIQIPVLEPSLKSILQHSPQGFFTTLTRPYPLESFSPLILIASLENLLIIILVLLSAFRFKKPDRQDSNIIIFSICITVILFTLIGLVTPIEGAIVRYKSVGLPFLFISILSFTKAEKVFGLFNRHPKK
jgi:hypothetical protein